MKPVLQALVLAEHVYQDISGKKIIAGTFSGVVCRSREEVVGEVELPDGNTKQFVKGGMHGGSPFAYISLTDIVDDTELTLQFVDLTHNQVLLEQALRIECHDRLQTVEIVAPLPPLPISGPGIYAFEVVCDGVILGSHRVTAVSNS